MLVLGSILVLVGCGGGGGGSAVKEVFTISYNGNGAESGVAPAKQSGDEDSPQSVQANTGNLVKSGYLFDGWNTSADGSGTSYTPGASYKGKNVTLYAKWAAIYNYEIISLGSPAPALYGQQKASGVSCIKILSLTARGKILASIVIPEAIDGYQVVAIGSGAFQGCDAVTELSIPNTVTSIEDNAFAGCTGISTLTIPNSVTSIGSGTFSGCTGLNSIVLLTATPPAMGTGALEGCTATVSVPAAGVEDYKAAEGWNTYSASIAGYSNEIHTVTFDSQGATKAANPASIAVEPPNVTVGALPTAPERTGYLFSGWFKEPGGAGGEFTASTVVSSNMTVYAKWKSYEYTVTFDDQGATTPSSPTSKTVASPNTTVDSLPSEPENTGYYFGGWNTKADGTGTVFNADTPVTSDITVYAVWLNNPTYTVTFDGQGATTQANPSSKSVVSPAITVESLPTPPEKTGHTFGGWYNEPEGAGGEFTASTVVTGNKTVFAKWTVNTYQITYKDKGGSAFSGVHGNNYPTSHIYGKNTTLVNPEKTGYTFDGWYTDSSCSGASLSLLEATSYAADIVLYAKWNANHYSVTYKDQGGGAFSGSHANQYWTGHTYGTDTPLDTPRKQGYLFGGYYDNIECTGLALTKLSATAYTDVITIYAKWDSYNYTVTFNSQDADVVASPSTTTVSSPDYYITQFPTAPSKDGYVFEGWFLDPDGEGTCVYSPNYNHKIKINGNITVYAKWNPLYTSVPGERSGVAIGDIVLSDGKTCNPDTYIKYTSYPTYYPDVEVVGVIAYIGATDQYGITDKIYMISIEESSNLIWSQRDYIQYINAKTSETAGENNWGIITTKDPTGTADAAENYPAFNYANTYSISGFTNGWFLPSKGELSIIFGNLSTINSSISKVKGYYFARTATELSVGYYWSSSLRVNFSEIWSYFYGSPSGFHSVTGSLANTSTGQIRPVRALDD